MITLYSVSVNSIMQASVASTFMMCLLYVFRKKDKFFDIINPKIFLLLYSLCLLRVLFPIEIEGHTRPVSGGIIWNQANSFLKKHIIYFGGLNFTFLDILVCIWIIIAIIKIGVYIKKYNVIHTIFWNSDEYLDAKKYVDTNSKRIHTKIVKVNYIDSPCCMGVFKRIIAIPVVDYSERELEIILKHEFEHLKNNDPLIKCAINIICKIYWWNPVIIFLQKNINQSLEICCDMRVIKNDIHDNRVEYLETILQEYNRKNEQKQEMMLALADGQANELYERFKAISSFKRKKSVGNNIIIAMTFCLFLAISYGFVVQAKYNPRDEDFGYYDGEVLSINRYNSYILKDKEGNYSLFYKESLFCNGKKLFDINKDELQYYTYNGTQIKEKHNV